MRRSPTRLGTRALPDMSVEDLEEYEAELELGLYREYRDVVTMFRYIVETERRFYLANEIDVTEREHEGHTWFDLELRDAWVWDMYRAVRFTSHVRVSTMHDVNIEDRGDVPDPTIELGALDEADG